MHFSAFTGGDLRGGFLSDCESEDPFGSQEIESNENREKLTFVDTVR